MSADPVAKLLHDLRTPLAIVAGFAELLERRGPELSPERRADYVANIREAAARLEALLAAVEAREEPSVHPEEDAKIGRTTDDAREDRA